MRDAGGSTDGGGPSGDGRRELAGRLHSTALRLLRHLRGEDGGLTPARLSALSALVFGGARRPGELAEAEGVTAPTMSAIAGALVERGLAAREPHPEDGRSVVLRATPEGRRLVEAGRDGRIERVRELLRALEPEEREAVAVCCGGLERALSCGEEGGREEGPGRG